MYFSFSVIFSFLAIFQVLQCAFLIFHVNRWFSHFSNLQVDVSHFPWFSVFLPYSMSYNVHSKFSTFFCFPRHISRPKIKCVFLIFRDFQFSRHIPGPSVGISHFLRFLVISSFFKSSFFTFFSDFVIFQVLKWMFLKFHIFSVFLPYSTSYSGRF